MSDDKCKRCGAPTHKGTTCYCGAQGSTRKTPSFERQQLQIASLIEDRDELTRQLHEAEDVMPLIGPMLDRWDELPNDVKCDEELEKLGTAITHIYEAMEDE